MKFSSTAFILAMLLPSASLTYGLELKDKSFKTDAAGTVVFSHDQHLEKKDPRSANISCKACHNGNMRENVRYTMADMEKGKSCGICHNGSKAFAVSKCTSCHTVRPITYRIKETGPTTFSHAGHLKSLQCKSCHNRIYKAGPNEQVGMVQMEKGRSCGACHNGKQSFALSHCVKCHPVKDRSFRVAGAGNVLFSHELHVAAFKCQDCHTGIYPPRSSKKTVTMTEMEAGKSCGACHDSKTAFTVTENCDRCHKV